MVGASAASGPPVPKEWPAGVADIYEPVRTLGKGGFAYVMLARAKSPKPGDDKLVAIKIVGGMDGLKRSDLGYARRETDILREIKHPHIMKLINYWEPEPNSTSSAAMALGYAQGPTLESLLRHGGACSVTFGRTVIAQLIDAVSFLHSHAVIHRDIKPDNLTVTGASSKQDEIWDNIDDENPPSWEDLRKKWRVTLIDFGFARALTPSDVNNPSYKLRKENLNASYHHIDLMAGVAGGSAAGQSIDKSISRKILRSMSAVGNRAFAAPEILNGIEEDEITKDESEKVGITETLSTSVSEYGLLVDAYSLGNTSSYTMTGVHPSFRIQDAIAQHNSLINRFCRWSKKKLSSKPLPRRVKYRPLSDLPEELKFLILDMTNKAEYERMSVRSARRSPYIAEVLPSLADYEKNISYLTCVEK